MERRNNRIELLNSRFFILAVIILLANDFILKPLFSNIITGKLSDFAGLFVFPFFISVFLFRHAKYVYSLVAFLFIIWKSPLSTDFILWWNSNMFFSITRVVDYSDLIALAILPLSYRYMISKSLMNINLRLISTVSMIALALFSFYATSQPRKEFNTSIDTNGEYIVQLSKDELFSRLSYRHGYSDTIEKNLKDSLFYFYFEIPEKWSNLAAIVEVNDDSINQTIIKLDSIVAFEIKGRFLKGIDEDDVEFIQSLSANDLEEYFKENFIDILEIGKNTGMHQLFFDNKEIHDQY